MKHRLYLYDGIKAQSVGDLDQWMDKEVDKEDDDPHSVYAAVPWVYRCVRLRANALSVVPHSLTKGKTEVDYPLDYMLPRLLWATEASLCLYGAAYWLREKNRAGVEGYRWIVPSSMTIKSNDSTGLTGFERRVSSDKTIQYKPEQVVYFWEPNLAAEVGPGVSPVQAGMTAANLGLYANEFASQFFKRGAIPATLLVVDGNPADKELRRLEEWWKRLLQGVKHAWETVAIRASVKPTIIGQPVKDLAMTELTTVARQQIAVALGIPQTLIEDSANYATAESHRIQFYENTIIPECSMIAGSLNEQVFKPQGMEFAFQPEQLDIMQEDEAQRAASLGALTDAGVPLILAMQMLGYDLPEGWDYDKLEETLHPKPAPLPAGPPATGVGDNADDNLGQRGPETPRPMAPEMIAAQQNPTPEVLAQRERMRQLGEAGVLSAAGKAMLADLQRWKRKATKAGKPVDFESDDIPAHVQGMVKAALASIGMDAFNFLKAADANTAAAEAALKALLNAAFTVHIQDVIAAVMAGQVPSLDALKAELTAGLLSQFIRIVTEQALRAAMAVGASFDPAVINAGAVTWAQAYTYELVKGLIETTQEVIRGAIAQFIGTPGMTMGELAKLLEPAFGEVRADMIAMTETTRAFAEATNETQDLLKESGIKMERVWKTSADEVVCPICAPLNGQPESEWADEFPDGPPGHVSCRCWLTLRLVKP